MSITDRLGSLSGGRESREEQGEPPDPSSSVFVQRCVIIQRDERGYGFTVSGDNPVFVASVKPDGAAFRAGVFQGDRIVKVNGTLVTSRNHLDVVKLIKSGSYVALTLLGKPQPGAPPSIPQPTTPTPNTTPSNRDSVHGRVTAPQPVDPDKDRELQQTKIHMTRTMYETAKEDYEKLQKQYVRSPSEKLHTLLLDKEKTVKTLEKQLRQLTGAGDDVVSPSTLKPLPNRFSDSEHGDLDNSAMHHWASSLPSSTTSDQLAGSSISDSPATSPSISPTPVDPYRYNGQDIPMEESTASPPDIITIDDEDFRCEGDQMNDPGPYADLKKLSGKPAHMAIVLNYLITNSDPSSVLFYLISEQYSRNSGSTKELRKWAYEIFSTFIVNEAPLKVKVEDQIINQLDSTLTTSTKTDNENSLRKMFDSAKETLDSEISDLLADFRNKMDLGMGNMYGYNKLQENMDKNQEARIAEDILIPFLEAASEESKQEKEQAIAWCVATFLRSLNLSKSSHTPVLERVQTFMMKDKRSIKFPGSKSSRAKAVKNHQFSLTHFYSTSYCKFCGHLIWGVGFQGYQCQTCEMSVHKQCVEEVQSICPKSKQKYVARLLPGMNTKRPANVNQTGQQLHSTVPEIGDQNAGATTPYRDGDDTDLAGVTTNHSVQSIVRRMEMGSPTGPGTVTDLAASAVSESPNNSSRRGSTDINRKGSLNSKAEKGEKPQRRSKSDVDVNEDTFNAINQSGSSSASSLSNRSVESPSNSTDNMNEALRSLPEDSDLDVEPDLPPLKQVLGDDVIRKLKPKEKKRQEVINELFYTERAHLRNLKIINLLFNMPMLRESSIMADLARALFPNMDEMIALHKSFNQNMIERRKTCKDVKQLEIGDILLKRFDGEAGERFRKGCAEYCRNQSFAIDALKKQTRKEARVAKFMEDTESNPLCRRLQLKDLVPSQMQRLTKYPLLIDSLKKHTQPNSEEYKHLERAHERCKHILAYVNQAVKECENYHKLKEIAKKLDNKLDMDIDITNTAHKLVYDGPLTLKLRPHKPVDLHVLLFDHQLILLEKQNEKYVLRHQNQNSQSAREDDKSAQALSPILRLQNVLARTVATDKTSIYIVNISENRAQMYEFSAATSEMRTKWCNLITQKSEELKTQTTSQHTRSVSMAEPSKPRVSAMVQRPEEEQVEIHRNKITRKSRKGRSVSNPVIPESHKDPNRLSPVSSDQVDSPTPMDTSDLISDTDLIHPEEVSVSEAIKVEALPVTAPLATLSQAGSHDVSASGGETGGSTSQATGVTSPDTDHQQDGLQQLKPPINVPVPMNQLKSMANEMNAILAKLMAAMNSGSEERHRLKSELLEAQAKLDALKEMQQQMINKGTVPSGRHSPRVQTQGEAAQRASGASAGNESSDVIPGIESTSEDDSAQTAASSSSSSSAIPATTSEEEPSSLATTVEDESGGRSTPTPASLSSEVLHGVQQETREEEIVESFNEDTQIVQVISETHTDSSNPGSSTGDQMIEVAMDDEDDDNNEVSVADLPLPDMASLRVSEVDLDPMSESIEVIHEESRSRLLDNVDLDQSDDEDDTETITPKDSQDGDALSILETFYDKDDPGSNREPDDEKFFDSQSVLSENLATDSPSLPKTDIDFEYNDQSISQSEIERKTPESDKPEPVSEIGTAIPPEILGDSSLDTSNNNNINNNNDSEV